MDSLFNCIKTIGFSGVAVLLFIGCSKDDEVKTRSFRMGFTPSPYEISPEEGYVYDKLAAEADIVNHYFDNGVPWEESLNGDDYHPSVVDDWNFRKKRAKDTHKTYVSVTPINFSRKGLASYRGSEGNMPLPAPWDAYRFNDEKVKTAYLNYCKRVIDFFEPDYFGMAIESNLLYVVHPELWGEYLQLHEFIYRELKGLYPDLPVFTSVAGAPMLDGFVEGNDYVQQRLAVMQLLQHSDYYALSFYPYLSKHQGNPYPENTFDELFSIFTKPMVVAEAGYTAEPFSMDMGEGSVRIQTDPVKQQKFVDDLLAATEERKAEFVIYSTIRDYDPLWASMASPTDINVAGRHAGLYDDEGNPRPALNSWREYFKKKMKE